MHQRDNKLQKKAVDYTLDKLNPYIHNIAGKALDHLLTKVRPNKRYETNRKDLDGGWLADRLIEQANSVKRLSAVPEAICVWKDALSGPTMKKE